MNKIGLIISREYITRVRKKSFIIMSLLGPLLIIGFVWLTTFLTKNDKENYEILAPIFSAPRSHQKRSGTGLSWDLTTRRLFWVLIVPSR